jgi:hypothetical protein
VKTSTDRHSKALSLYRRAFDDVVSDLIKVKAADNSERLARRVKPDPTRPGRGHDGRGRVRA